MKEGGKMLSENEPNIYNLIDIFTDIQSRIIGHDIEVTIIEIEQQEAG